MEGLGCRKNRPLRGHLLSSDLSITAYLSMKNRRSRRSLDHGTENIQRGTFSRITERRLSAHSAEDADIYLNAKARLRNLQGRQFRQIEDIRAIQELLSHSYPATTMIHTHVLRKGGLGIQSPFDVLWQHGSGLSPPAPPIARRPGPVLSRPAADGH